MNHGTATIRKVLVDLENNPVVHVGEEGIITAYLPEMDKFAVMFSENRWYTFTETEEQFLIRFDVKRNEL